jgi:hypothetical protein
LTTFSFLESIAKSHNKKRSEMNRMSAPAASRPTPVDPITLEVIRHGIISISTRSTPA